MGWSFPNLKFFLFVGIGGGIPRTPSTVDPLKDIRLGDIVVGWAKPGEPAIMEYDYVRFFSENKCELLGTVDKSDAVLIQHLNPFVSNRVMSENPRFQENLDRLDGLRGYQHPGSHLDVLFEVTCRLPEREEDE